MKTMREWRYSSTIFNFNARWKCVLTITPLPLYTWKNSPQYPLHQRLSSDTADQDATEKRKNSCPCQESNPNSSVVQPIA
jgi:hypothetical protein